MDEKIARQTIGQNKKSYNAIAEDFDVTRQAAWPEFEMLLPYIKGGDRILDIGCGNGRLLKFIQDSKLKIKNYTGVDQSEELIKIARNNFPEADFLVADIFNLPFADASFDVAAGIAFLHHIPSQELRAKVLKEIYRVLAPGGILFLTNWNLFQMKLIKKYKLRLRDFFFPHNDLDASDFWIPFHPSSHPAPSPCHPARSDSGDAGSRGVLRYYHHFNEKELARLCRNAGFKILKYKKGKNNILILKKCKNLL